MTGTAVTSGLRTPELFMTRCFRASVCRHSLKAWPKTQQAVGRTSSPTVLLRRRVDIIDGAGRYFVAVFVIAEHDLAQPKGNALPFFAVLLFQDDGGRYVAVVRPINPDERVDIRLDVGEAAWTVLVGVSGVMDNGDMYAGFALDARELLEGAVHVLGVAVAA